MSGIEASDEQAVQIVEAIELVDMRMPGAAPGEYAKALLEAPAFQAIIRAAQAEALRRFAEHLDGGTPRAWDFHHPCDPAGVRWEPDERQTEVMRVADNARDTADRIEATDV